MRLMMAAAAMAALLAGCATGMSEDECAGADWADIGQRDGLYGEGPDKFNERAERCAGFGLEADYEAYQAGRSKGLRTYCTPEAGYDAGRNGRPYRGVCPADLEGEFLSEYNIGRRLFDLSAALDEARSDYDDAVEDLERSRYEFRKARERFNDPNLSEADRKDAGKDMDRYRRKIEDLEDALPRMSDEIHRAEGELEDYRAFVARRSRR